VPRAGAASGMLFRQLTSRLTVVVHDSAEIDTAELEALQAAGVDVVWQRVRRIVSDAAGRVTAVELIDDARIAADAVVVGPRFTVRAEPLLSLGIRPAAPPS